MLEPNELDFIKESAASMDEADLRFFPAVYTHRHRLLGYLKWLEETHAEIQTDHDALVKELDTMLNGENGAQAPRLCDIVAQVRHIVDRKPITLKVPPGFDLGPHQVQGYSNVQEFHHPGCDRVVGFDSSKECTCGNYHCAGDC